MGEVSRTPTFKLLWNFQLSNRKMHLQVVSNCSTQEHVGKNNAVGAGDM
jgi:hypothetical protein